MTEDPFSRIHEGDGMPELVVIPPGAFLMGSPETETGHEDWETPQHAVTLSSPFALGRTPVTFQQWDVFLADGGTGYRPDDEGWGRDDRPVINVSWQDAQAYVGWLASRSGRPYRLPTESEWEYAARAGTDTAYFWGDAFAPGRANCLDDPGAWGGKATAPVASFPANPFGLSDMLGNVWEWTEDVWSEFYLNAPDDGSARRHGDLEARALRGGSWCDPARMVRAASRNRNGLGFRCNDYGFRVALSL